MAALLAGTKIPADFYRMIVVDIHVCCCVCCRYGKIQSVKIQPPAKDSETTITATVAFMDIRSASKAHNSKNTIDSNVLRTEYWDALSSTVRTQGDSARSSSSIPGASGTYGSGAPASTVSRSAGSNGSSGAHGSWTTG